VARAAGVRVAHVPRGYFIFEDGGEAYLIDLTVVDSTAKTYRWDRSSWRIGSDWCEESALKAAHEAVQLWQTSPSLGTRSPNRWRR